MKRVIQFGIFIIRYRFLSVVRSKVRNICYKVSGMQIGIGTKLPPLHINWPHQVAIGRRCVLEHEIHFKFDGIWKSGTAIVIHDNVFIGQNCEFNIKKSIEIGNDSLIASGCKFIDHDHGTDTSELMRTQMGVEKSISIGENVWLGCNVIVLKGVQINDGAIVAAGSVVTKSIGTNEIWAGIPAKKIGTRN